MICCQLIERAGPQKVRPAIAHVRERELLPLDPRGNDGCPHAPLFGIGGCSLKHFTVRQVDGAREGDSSAQKRQTVAPPNVGVARLFSAVDSASRSFGQQGCLPLRHALRHPFRPKGQTSSAQVLFDNSLRVLSDAAKIGSRAGFDTQKGPRLKQPLSCTGLRSFSAQTTHLYRFETYYSTKSQPSKPSFGVQWL